MNAMGSPQPSPARASLRMADALAVFLLLLLLFGALTVASRSRLRDDFAVAAVPVTYAPALPVVFAAPAAAPGTCSIRRAQVEPACGGNAVVPGWLDVKGATTLEGGAAVSGDAALAGIVHVAGLLDAKGAATLASLAVAGASKLGGDAQVGGALCIGKAGNATEAVGEAVGCLRSGDVPALKSALAAAVKTGSSPSFGAVTAGQLCLDGSACMGRADVASFRVALDSVKAGSSPSFGAVTAAKLCVGSSDSSSCVTGEDVAALQSAMANAGNTVEIGSSPKFGTMTARSVCVGGTCMSEGQLQTLLGLGEQIGTLGALDKAFKANVGALKTYDATLQAHLNSMSKK